MLAVPGAHRRLRHQESVERLQVRIAGQSKMRVGECRIEMRAVAMDTFPHGALERRVRPVADAGLDIGCDVRAVDDAERSFDFAAAGICNASNRRMADLAVAEACELPAALDGGGGKHRRIR